MSTCGPVVRLGGRVSGTTVVDGDVDALPVVGAVVGRQRRPLVAVLEPARAELEVALALVAVALVDDHRLHVERHDDVVSATS